MSPLQRTPIKRRPRRGRTLTREQWEELYALVIRLDLDVVIEWAEKRGDLVPLILPPGSTRIISPKGDLCPAVVMDPSLLGTCSGEWRLDHVKEDPMMGQKAPDDEEHLVALCAAHDERGAKAGSQWNTAHRAEENTYLREHRPGRQGGGGSDLGAPSGV